jgi:hypothetical protein
MTGKSSSRTDGRFQIVGSVDGAIVLGVLSQIPLSVANVEGAIKEDWGSPLSSDQQQKIGSVCDLRRYSCDVHRTKAVDELKANQSTAAIALNESDSTRLIDHDSALQLRHHDGE